MQRRVAARQRQKAESLAPIRCALSQLAVAIDHHGSGTLAGATARCLAETETTSMLELDK